MPVKKEQKTYLKTLYITAAFCAAVMFLLFPSCSGKEKNLAEAVSERDTLPSMNSLGVTTLISDSGVTRYKIVTEEWTIFDKKNPPSEIYLIDPNPIADTKEWLIYKS